MSALRINTLLTSLISAFRSNDASTSALFAFLCKAASTCCLLTRDDNPSCRAETLALVSKASATSFAFAFLASSDRTDSRIVSCCSTSWLMSSMLDLNTLCKSVFDAFLSNWEKTVAASALFVNSFESSVTSRLVSANSCSTWATAEFTSLFDAFCSSARSRTRTSSACVSSTADCNVWKSVFIATPSSSARSAFPSTDFFTSAKERAAVRMSSRTCPMAFSNSERFGLS
mmetsp:Transcript_140/g.261  ORF Transcript_140/g.261 Transcript_140/m.261 type:complete len:230 (-) Transcript_140:418-1107(-)